MTKQPLSDQVVSTVDEITDGCQTAVDAYVALRRAADSVFRFVEAELGAKGVTTAQYGILLESMRSGPLMLTELSDLIFRSNSTITALIDRLEADELVKRLAHETDRRVTLVELTPAGRDLMERIRGPHRAALADMLACLSPEEMVLLRGLVDRVRAHIEQTPCLGEDLE
jgi:MarR family 2-MHQ and catechol resistance regulon transcriptional repressor